MQATGKRNVILINPNWSAFILLVTLLSVFNSLVLLIPPLADEGQSLLRSINIAVSLILWADFVYLLHRSANRRRFMTK